MRLNDLKNLAGASVSETLQAIPTAEDSTPPPIYYFAYGMLTDPRIMPGAEFLGSAILKNHSLEFKGYANVRPGTGQVIGTLWNIDRRLLSELDQAEGYPSLYDRKTVPVFHKGQRYEAMIYTMTPSTREQLAKKAPSKNYIARLVKGYNHANIPLTQISRALDRNLDEVSMNPRSFARSIKQASDQGVLVGYEFEVCIPYDTIKNAKVATSSQLTVDSVILDIKRNGVALEYITSQDPKFNKFFKIFQFTDRSIPYRSVKALQQAMMKSLLPQLIQTFEKIPPKVRARNKNFVLRQLQNDRDYQYDSQLEQQFSFAYHLGQRIYWQERRYDMQGYELRRLASAPESLGELLSWALGITTDQLDSNFADYFTFTDPNRAYEFLELEDEDQDYMDDEDPEYPNAAKNILKPAIDTTYGTNSHVFYEYHQKKKNLTDWYIEPDGSLTPTKPNDSSAEIVSPPLPVPQALDAVNKFFSMARQLKLYTNESTGLHINVSIPKNIDVLKLAVLLGEPYVLKTFDREDNPYVQSVIKRLSPPNIGQGRPDKGFVNAPKQLQKLQDLATTVSKPHKASVNSAGGYISFRHVGGNYLADPQGTVLAISRFIQAMVIASDPDAYRNEYLSKLTRLFPQEPTPIKGTGNRANRSRMLAAIQKIRQQGWPAVQRDIAYYKTPSLKVPNNFASGFNIIDGAKNNSDSRNVVLNRLKMQKNKETVQKLPAENFVRITGMLPDINLKPEDFDLNLSGVDRDQRLGMFFTDTIVYIPATHPIVQGLIKKMAEPFIKQQIQQRQKQTALPKPKLTENSLYYKGYPCTIDCSGHMAGYIWAKIKGIRTPEECPIGNSNSFYEGCRSYAEGR